ncbi:expressed unknown protein [Seminavis robusta]|uniref:Uncharacterized protein n=1 Tax=Seminavis robusta TaxID=568900 RepID=A0A9N8DDI1_9STRA|nr:expressed unknown protein [Seminavis robusta]|eukprot:Sro40_g024440.1 n/a (297) ;mRNA; r:4751-5812
MAVSRCLERLLLLLLAAFLPSALLAQDSTSTAEQAGDATAGGSGSLRYEPIASLDETAYLGTWKQAYASFTVIYTFELGGNCVTADYYATEKNRTVRVENKVRPFGDRGNGYHRGYEEDKPKDKEDYWEEIVNDCLTLTVNGWLTQSPDVDGQGYVELQPGPLPFGIGTPDIDDVMYMPPGNYWIMMLGPIRNGEYQYSVVTDGEPKSQLYILVRDVDEFEQRWKADVLWQVEKWGFTGFTNRPRKTNQEDCGYPTGAHPDDDYYKDDHYKDDYYKDDYYKDDYYNDDHRPKHDDW